MCMFHDTRITHGKPKVLATTVNQGCYSWLFGLCVPEEDYQTMEVDFLESRRRSSPFVISRLDFVTVLMIDAIDVTWWQPQEIQQRQDNA